MEEAERGIQKILPEFRKIGTPRGALEFELGEDATESIEKIGFLGKFYAATNPRSLYLAINEFPEIVKRTEGIERSVDPYWVARILDEIPGAREFKGEILKHEDPKGVYRAVTGRLLKLEDAVRARNPLHAGLALAAHPEARAYKEHILRSNKPEELARAIINHRMGRYADHLSRAPDPEWVAAVLSDPQVPGMYKRMILQSLARGEPARIHLAARIEARYHGELEEIMQLAGLKRITARSGTHFLVPVKVYGPHSLRGRSIEIGQEIPVTFKGIGYKGLVPFSSRLKSGKISREEAEMAAEGAMKANKWFEGVFGTLRENMPSVFEDYRFEGATIIPLAILRLRQIIIPGEKKLWKPLATIPPVPLPKMPMTARLKMLDAIAKQNAEKWAREFRDTHPLAYTLPVGNNTRVMEVLMGERREDLKRTIQQAGGSEKLMQIFGARLGAVEGMLMAKGYALTDPEASSFAPHNVTIHGIPVDIEAPNENPSHADRFKEIANALETIRYLALAARTSPLPGYIAFKRGIITGYSATPG